MSSKHWFDPSIGLRLFGKYPSLQQLQQVDWNNLFNRLVGETLSAKSFVKIYFEWFNHKVGIQEQEVMIRDYPDGEILSAMIFENDAYAHNAQSLYKKLLPERTAEHYQEPVYANIDEPEMLILTPFAIDPGDEDYSVETEFTGSGEISSSTQTFVNEMSEVIEFDAPITEEDSSNVSENDSDDITDNDVVKIGAKRRKKK